MQDFYCDSQYFHFFLPSRRKNVFLQQKKLTMPRLDKYHPHVRAALEKDGWTITHDPCPLEYDDTVMSVDLAAERILAAERGTEKLLLRSKHLVNPHWLIHFMRLWVNMKCMILFCKKPTPTVWFT